MSWSTPVRIPGAAHEGSGLKKAGQVMVDKMVALGRSRIARVIGRLSEDEMARVSSALILWLDLGAPAHAR